MIVNEQNYFRSDFEHDSITHREEISLYMKQCKQISIRHRFTISINITEKKYTRFINECILLQNFASKLVWDDFIIIQTYCMMYRSFKFNYWSQNTLIHRISLFATCCHFGVFGISWLRRIDLFSFVAIFLRLLFCIFWRSKRFCEIFIQVANPFEVTIECKSAME